MGCFDAACSLSGMTIKSGDDAVLLLLVPAREYVKQGADERCIEIEPCMMMVHNDGPFGMYKPFCLPIRGKYNDYGSLEDLVRDDTVKGLEKFFGIKFEQLVGIIHRGKYGTLFDDEVQRAFGTGLEIKDTTLEDKKISEGWLAKAGFIKQADGSFVHEETGKLREWDPAAKEWKDTDKPSHYVVFKANAEGATNKKEVYPHVMYYEMNRVDENNIKMELESDWAWGKKDFCELFYKKTETGFGGGNGIMLGIKKENRDKARISRKLSGMFIDGKLYTAMTESIKTNAYAKEQSGILDKYPNRFMMEAMGFKFERAANSKKNFQTVDMPTGTLGYEDYDTVLIYTHDLAPGKRFSVGLKRNMCVDFYEEKDGKLKEIKTYIENKHNYHPFSAKGVAKMFKGVTGNELDLSALEKIKPIDITFTKIRDHIERRNGSKKIVEELRLKVDAEKDKEKRMNLVMRMIRLDDRSSDSREGDKDTLESFYFPVVYEFYEKLFLEPTDKFKKDCERFKNFVSSLWGINRMLMPSSHFSQHGDYSDQLAFTQLAVQVLKKKILSNDNEFGEKERLEEMVTMIYGPDFKVGKPVKKKDRTITPYTYNGKKVAEWDELEQYGCGYLTSK